MKLLLLLSFLSAFAASSQPYTLLSNRNVFTDEIVAGHYQSIRWCSERAAAVFQPTLSFSNLSVIADEKGKTYSILLQLDAEGKLIYIGVQSVLCNLLQCSPSVEMNYLSAMKQLLQSGNANEEEIVNCLIKRLNDCQLFRKNQPR